MHASDLDKLVLPGLCFQFVSYININLRLISGHRHRGSYMSAHALLNLLNKLGKRDKMRVVPHDALYQNSTNGLGR